MPLLLTSFSHYCPKDFKAIVGFLGILLVFVRDLGAALAGFAAALDSCKPFVSNCFLSCGRPWM